MGSKMKDSLVADIRSLVKHLTEFDETDENFTLCVNYALSNIVHHKYLSVDSHNVRRSITGIADKLFIHGHLEQSKQFSSLINKFLNATWFKDCHQSDIQWALLSFLLNLSNNPTTNLKPVKPSVPPKEPEEIFDWGTYLKEGNENFFDKFGDDTLSDPLELSESSDCGQDKEVPTVAGIAPAKQSDTEIIKKKEVVSESVEAENWLRENLQHSWWTANEINEKVVSKFPAANLSKLWQDNSLELIDGSSDAATTCTISEYKVMREILFMLHFPATTCIFQEENEAFVFRKNFTIPSLTKPSLHKYLEKFCKYFTIVYELRKFLDFVNPDIKCQSQTVPHTLEAYATAIRQFLLKFWEFLVPIEVQVAKQDTINTLYLLYLDIEPKLRELQDVYDIHVRATSEWKTSPNWLISTRLLSVLYSAATSAVDEVQSSLFLGLFLKSFAPYLDVIHTWLVEGRFEDWRQEFIIARNEKVPIDSWNMWESGFLIHPYFIMLKKTDIEPLPLLKNVCQKILHAGKSIEMLKQLNRHAEFSKLSKGKNSLYAELLLQMDEKLNGVYSELTEIPLDLPQSESTDNNLQIQNLSVNSLSSLVEDPVANSLLMKARDYVFKNPCQTDKKVTITDDNSDVLTRIIDHVSKGSFPIKPVIEQSFTHLMEERHRAACLLLKNILQNDYNILVHLSLVKEIFLIGSGDMQRFCSHIFQESEKTFPWANSVALTAQLENCVDERYPSHSSCFSVVVNNRSQTVVSIDSMDDITIKYSTKWPMTLILSSENMEIYNAVFQFLMKVKWAVWALEQLRFSSLEPRTSDGDVDGSYERKRKLLWLLRFWLLHSVGSVHSYLMGQVLLSLGLQLEKDLEAACDLDTIIKVHNDYVQKVYSHCLQPKSNDIIKTAILQLATLALKLREVWLMGVEIVSEEFLLKMGETYLKYHWFLGSVLQNSVDSQYNTQNLYQLPSKSKTSIPSGFNSPLRFSLSNIAWQVDPPSGFHDSLPSHLQVFLQNDIWDDKKRPRTFPAADLLHIFLDSYLKFSVSDSKQNCFDEKYFYLTLKGQTIVKEDVNNVSTVESTSISSNKDSDIELRKANLIKDNVSIGKMKMTSEKQKPFIRLKTKFKTVCKNKYKLPNINFKSNCFYIPTPLVYTSAVFTNQRQLDVNFKREHTGTQTNMKYLSEVLCFPKYAHVANNCKCKCTKICNFIEMKRTLGKKCSKCNDMLMMKSWSDPCITFRMSESITEQSVPSTNFSSQQHLMNNNYDMNREKQDYKDYCCQDSNILQTINLHNTALIDSQCKSSNKKEELSLEKSEMSLTVMDSVKYDILPPIKSSNINSESKIPKERWKRFYNTNLNDCCQAQSFKSNHLLKMSKCRSQKILLMEKKGPGSGISNLNNKPCRPRNTADPVGQQVDCILPRLPQNRISHHNKDNGAAKNNKRSNSCPRNTQCHMTNIKPVEKLSVTGGSLKNSKRNGFVSGEREISPFACETFRPNKLLTNKDELQIHDQLYDHVEKTKCLSDE